MRGSRDAPCRPHPLLFLQTEMSAKKPSYFAVVLVGSLIAGGVGWLIAAVLGFARARAFGASARWFSMAAVCLLIYHIQFLLLGFVAILGAQQNDFDAVLDFRGSAEQTDDMTVVAVKYVAPGL